MLKLTHIFLFAILHRKDEPTMYRDNLFQTINLSTTLQNMFKNISSFYSFMKKKKFMEEESQKLLLDYSHCNEML